MITCVITNCFKETISIGETWGAHTELLPSIVLSTVYLQESVYTIDWSTHRDIQTGLHVVYHGRK